MGKFYSRSSLVRRLRLGCRLRGQDRVSPCFLGLDLSLAGRLFVIRRGRCD
jgi:hypothetical protein